MSVIMVVIDGAIKADYIGCENVDKADYAGFVNNVPQGRESNSLTCIMNMLHVPVKFIPKGRAYLECLALDIPVCDDDLIFRCNNTFVEKGMLIGNKNDDLNLDFGDYGRLISLGSYKNLLILHHQRNLLNEVRTYAPHENFNRTLGYLMPASSNLELNRFLQDLVKEYNIFPWDQSVKSSMPSFAEINKMKGAVVCKTEVVKGIAKALKMHCPDLKNATADIDTDLEEKADEALRLNKDYDFVMLHINGADECAHRRDGRGKKNFIKKIDEIVLKKLYKNIDKNTSLIVTSDHGTSSSTGAHLLDDVRYYLYNKSEEALHWLKR